MDWVETACFSVNAKLELGQLRLLAVQLRAEVFEKTQESQEPFFYITAGEGNVSGPRQRGAAQWDGIVRLGEKHVDSAPLKFVSEFHITDEQAIREANEEWLRGPRKPYDVFDFLA